MKKTQNTNLHKLVLINKAPLSKSLSMPDMENRIKKRERLLAYVPSINNGIGLFGRFFLAITVL